MGSNPRTAALCAVLACGLATASAQEATTPSSFSPGITLGFEERVRQERWNNVDHNSASADARIQERFRTRIWADADLSPDLKLSAGLCNENRKITRPDTAVYNGREVFFETLSADYRFTRELSARLGRQNIMKGEGFIFMDGTPGDGSRSGFSDALDVTWSHGDSRLDALLIDNASRDRLPEVNRIGNPKEANLLAEWNEKALVLYYTGKAWSGSTLDAYYVYKTETDFDAWNSTRIGYQPDRRFSTLGARVPRTWEMAGPPPASSPSSAATRMRASTPATAPSRPRPRTLPPGAAMPG
nr:hypothetical protein [uncultured Holophaga sp.]